MSKYLNVSKRQAQTVDFDGKSNSGDGTLIFHPEFSP